MEKLGNIIRGHEIFALDPRWTALDAARYMTEKRIGAAAVLDGGKLVGVFSERDLMTRVVAAGLPADQTPVADVMARNPVTAHPEERPEVGLRRMIETGCRHLPIVKDGALLGLISVRDLIQAELDERDQEIRLSNEYLSGPLPRII